MIGLNYVAGYFLLYIVRELLNFTKDWVYDVFLI